VLIYFNFVWHRLINHFPRQYFGLQSHIPAFIFEDIPSLVLNIIFIIKLGQENFNYVAGASLCCSSVAGFVKFMEIKRYTRAFAKARKKGFTNTQNAVRTAESQSFRVKRSEKKSSAYLATSQTNIGDLGGSGKVIPDENEKATTVSQTFKDAEIVK
jgi:hypothetical protein